MPFRVQGQDEADLPGATLLFQLLLTQDCVRHRVVHLVVDEQLDAVTSGEAVDETLIMLDHAMAEIARHADVEDAIWLAGENVDAGLHEVDRVMLICREL